ncbi:MAG TPA: M15 family metallopeptidase [Telluria sp.]|jgi:peptidoglycan L-alanyl-D-glutamate endopeptidase CwlK
MRLTDMISEVQSTLGIAHDGKAGPETWNAIYNRIVQPKSASLSASAALLPVDARSEKCIATLHPSVQPYARALLERAKLVGVTIKIISGTRSFEEQDALFAQGRTRPGAIVTNARGGQSNHNFGIAFDIGIFESGQYQGESPKYKVVGALGVELGLEWGGNWKTIHDEPHFQLRPVWAETMPEKQMLAALRTRHDEGADFFA